jgi:hypothetical protein
MSEEMSNRTRLILEKRHQLIDLNKEFINFDIMFECKSVDATKDFEIIVVNQEQLNTIDLTNLTMKRTKGGYISGNIVADEDKYQNYFLILRSATEEPVEVDLEIKIKQIEPKPQQPPPQQQQLQQQQPMEFPQQPLPPPLANQILDDEIIYPTTNRRQLVFMVVGLLIIGGAIGYYFWSKNRPISSLLDDDAHSVYSEKSSSSKHSSSSSEKSGLLETLLHKEKA